MKAFLEGVVWTCCIGLVMLVTNAACSSNSVSSKPANANSLVGNTTNSNHTTNTNNTNNANNSNHANNNNVATVPLSFVSVTPTTGSVQGGTTVTITGEGFIPNSTVVYFDLAVCSNMVVSNGNKTITCSTPSHAQGVVGITLLNPGGTTVVANHAYTYITIVNQQVSIGNGGGISFGNNVRLTGMVGLPGTVANGNSTTSNGEWQAIYGAVGVVEMQ